MDSGPKTAFLVALVAAAGAAGYFALTPACACTTPDQKAHGQLNSDIGRVVRAAQAFRTQHGHYARTIEEIGDEARPSSSEIALTAVTDTSFHLEAKSMNPGITCTMDVTPRTREEAYATCTGHTSNR